MVDDLVVDIVIIFYWLLFVIDVMLLIEVLDWWYKVIQRSGVNDE